MTGNDVSRRESGTLAVASTSLGPWKTAAAVGAVGGAAALGIDLISMHWSLSILAGPAGIGLFLFFLVGGAGSVLTRKGGDHRLRRWAAEHPWQTAAVPAAGLFVTNPAVPAAGLFVTNTLTEYFLSTSSGVFSSIFTALWHAIILFGIVGVVGAVSGSRRRG